MGDWPLVGREAELSRLRPVVIGGAYSGAVIAGGPGVGKTRLALECLRMAERAGMRCVRVAATGSAEGRLAALAGEREARAVVLVDDAHLLGGPAAGLLLQLAMDGAACVVAAVPAGEPVADGVVTLWKDGLADRVDLTGLARPAVEELLWTTLRGPVEPATVTQLFNQAQENLHFLRELVNGALEDGSLRDDGGIWRLVAPLSPSPRLAELVERRMGALDEADRDLLEVVAFAEPLGRAEVTAVTEPARLDRLLRRGLLVSRTDRSRLEVRLAHPLYAELLRRRLSPLRVPPIARALAEAVEATSARRREDTLRVASWNVVAGVSRPDLMLAAAREARWHYDFPLAERLATAAFDAGAGFEAAVLAAQVACLRGRVAEAQERLTALADQATTDAQRGLAAVNLIDTLGVYRGSMDEGLRLAERIEARITDPNWRNEITARRAVILSATDGPRTATDLALPLVEESQGRALVWACMCSAFTLPRLGRVAEALELVDRGHAEHLELTEPIDRYPWIHAWLRCEALAHAGRLHEAETLALAEHEQGVADASAEAQAYFAWHLATVVGDRGHVRSAARHAREGIAVNRELGRPHYVGECLIGLALALALAGAARDAAAALADFDALDLPHAIFKPLELELARGWTAVASGDFGRGGELFLAAAGEARRRGDLVGEAAALHSRARIDRPAEVLGRLEDLAAGIEGDLAAGRAAHVRALAAGDADGLAEVSAAFERMGADLLAAEAAAQAALALRRRGEARRATATERRMEGLRERCEGALTPALQAVGVPGAADPVGTPGGAHGRRGPFQQRDRRGAVRLRPHRREPFARHLREARHPRPGRVDRRAGRLDGLGGGRPEK